ncbi:hypothetical protein V6U90_06535 [Micromonospora sp. CPCC 206060]|uniref:hypothetical protein n=1 Tax=Micromonospora sp. CPCC 206060 TaxID=3122406 RepID=UPI002FF337E1
MIIDDEVEQRVRDALHWVVKRNPNELDRTFATFPEDTARLAALELLIAVITYTVVDAFGYRPSSDEIKVLADEVADLEEWSSVQSSEVAAFIEAVFAGQPLADRLPGDSIFILAFIIAGNLLASHPNKQGEWWFNYLDRVEAAIEAADQGAK